jgi:hypothetical protein
VIWVTLPYLYGSGNIRAKSADVWSWGSTSNKNKRNGGRQALKVTEDNKGLLMWERQWCKHCGRYL